MLPILGQNRRMLTLSLNNNQVNNNVIIRMKFLMIVTIVAYFRALVIIQTSKIT